jgi:hypothetical protein
MIKAIFFDFDGTRSFGSAGFRSFGRSGFRNLFGFAILPEVPTHD